MEVVEALTLDRYTVITWHLTTWTGWLERVLADRATVFIFDVPLPGSHRVPAVNLDLHLFKYKIGANQQKNHTLLLVLRAICEDMARLRLAWVDIGVLMLRGCTVFLRLHLLILIAKPVSISLPHLSAALITWLCTSNTCLFYCLHFSYSLGDCVGCV